jgi:hypothetical protein
METNTTLGVAVVFATFAGPIAAVLITRWIDRKRALRDRQLEVFRALMRTRKSSLQPDHVNALNLVEIEFHGVGTVLGAYRDLMRHINTPTAFNEQWLNTHRSYLTKLLSAMAKDLGYTIEQLDVFEGGYYPSGWGQIEEQNLAMRLGFLELLSGKRSLPVHDSKQAAAPQSSFQNMADRLTNPNPPLK